MAITDPAWFYSTLAQTTAAIVGLIGAVLGSRIVDHVGMKRQARRELDELSQETAYHFHTRIESLKQYRELMQRQIKSAKKNIETGCNHGALTQREWDGTSISHTGVNLEAYLLQTEPKVPICDKLLATYVPISGPLSISELSDYEDRLSKACSELGDATALAISDRKKIKTLREKFSRFLADLVPMPFAIVLLILGWLTIGGILWPLAALPGIERSGFCKPGMIICLASGVLALIGYFSYQLFELNRLGKIEVGRLE